MDVLVAFKQTKRSSLLSLTVPAFHCLKYPERWNIYSAHPITLFTHFKTNTKSTSIYRLLTTCLLLNLRYSESHEMG